jgi:maltose/moltooligosaccharide transporter
MPFSGSLIMAAGLLWILDTSVNISMEPFRAFVADMLPEEQRTVGYSIQTLFVSIGAVSASAFPWLLEHIFGMSNTATAPTPEPLAGVGVGSAAHSFYHYLYHKAEVLLPFIDRIPFADRLPHIIRFSFHFGAAIFIICVLWTIITVREYPPEKMARGPQKKPGGIRHFFGEILADLLHMPKTMRELAWVQFFTWMGLFCMWIYFPVSVGHLFGTEGSQAYTEGIEWAGICFAGYNFVTFLYSFAMPGIARKISRKNTHILSLLVGACGLMGVLLLHPGNIPLVKKVVMLLMVGIGIGWGSILTMPYAMLSTAIPKEKMGIYMGIFNFFITLPQIVVSLGFGWVMKNLLHNNRQLGVVCGGICWVIAALLTLRVHDRGAQKQMDNPKGQPTPAKAAS